MTIAAIVLAICLIFVLSREICLFKNGLVWVDEDGAVWVYPYFSLIAKEGIGLFYFLSGLDVTASPPTPLYISVIKIEIGERGILVILTPWIGWAIGIAFILGWPPVRVLISKTLRDWEARSISDTGNEGSDGGS